MPLPWLEIRSRDFNLVAWNLYCRKWIHRMVWVSGGSRNSPALGSGAWCFLLNFVLVFWPITQWNASCRLFVCRRIHPLGVLKSEATYFRGQQQILGLAHEPVVLFGGHCQSTCFVAEEGKVQHHEGIPSAPWGPTAMLLARSRATKAFSISSSLRKHTAGVNIIVNIIIGNVPEKIAHVYG